MSRKKLNTDLAWQKNPKVPDALKNPATLSQLATPSYYLTEYGTVLDQASDEIIPFRHDICPPVQHSILAYASDPPRQASGHTQFLAVVAARQTTKSATAANALVGKVQYTPGTKAITIADEDERANALFEHAMLTYQNTPEEIRFPVHNVRAMRQLNFLHGGSYRAFTSGYTGNTGLGRGVAHTHISEGPFHKDFGDFWTKYLPAVVNRKNATLIMESTPASMKEPSAAAYRDLMMEAKQGLGRWLYVFAPFWTSVLNERPWNRNMRLNNDELALLELYGPKDGGPLSRPGNPTFLTLENLAFLREIQVMDPKIRRDPGLLWVFYPKDDISCWHQTGNSAIPGHAMEALLRRSGGPDSLLPWAPDDDQYMEFRAPRDDATYVLGADPAGWGSGDPSSFQVLEVWSDAVVQVAEYSTNTCDPRTFAEKIIEVARRFNDAEVFCENNGVGAGTIMALELAMDQGRLKNLHYYSWGKPGVPNSPKRHEEAMGFLIDFALDKSNGGRDVLEIRSRNLQAQLATYRHDKVVQKSIKADILVPDEPGAHRRHKHHWDRVSAFLWACYGVQFQRLRSRPKEGPEAFRPVHEAALDPRWLAKYRKANRREK